MNKIVAVVIPVYNAELSPYEDISLRQCLSILGHYPIIFVCPKNIKSSSFHEDYSKKAKFIFFEDEHFESIITYNRMMLSVWFYANFIEYKYILIYQLDCFVFKDELMFWVEKNYSYIGAPWFLGNSNDDSVDELIGVGNGGFSLRNITHCIKVLKSTKKIKSLQNCIENNKQKNNSLYFLRALRQYFNSFSFKTIHNNIEINEDKIFSHAANRLNFFKIPNPSIASAFAFEKQPNKLFKINNNQLPFGCHAWHRNNVDFYKPIINHFGYKII